jgi:hypothetical protein
MWLYMIRTGQGAQERDQCRRGFKVGHLVGGRGEYGHSERAQDEDRCVYCHGNANIGALRNVIASHTRFTVLINQILVLYQLKCSKHWLAS